jgi:small multidrug resistance family-3 protein
MSVLRSVLLFSLAVLAETGGAWLVWQDVRSTAAWGSSALGSWRVAATVVATFHPDPYFGRVLAAYGGVCVAGSLAWCVLVDGFRRTSLRRLRG